MEGISALSCVFCCFKLQICIIFAKIAYNVLTFRKKYDIIYSIFKQGGRVMNNLVNFKVKNFRSFHEETIFSMQAISNKEFSELNTFFGDEKLFPKNENELLKTAIIFGANASGKTNLVKALDYMRDVVLNSSNPINPLIPNNTPFAFYNSSEFEPTLFEIEIISNNVFYKHGLPRFRI